MRFRQGSLIEAAFIYVVASVSAFLGMFLVFSGDLASLIGAFSVEAIFLLLPSFVLWLLSGQVTKTRPYYVRFLVQVSINTAVSIVLLSFFDKSDQTFSIDPTFNLRVQQSIIATYFLGSLLGSMVTNFWFVKRAQTANRSKVEIVKRK